VSTLAIIAATMALGFIVGRLSAWRTLRRLRKQLTMATHRAFHDPLTGLPNRLHAEHLFTRTSTPSGAVVVLLDLDRFKGVNDAHGHHAGDELLVVVACRLLAGAQAHSGTAARLAGDEFLLILPTHHADNSRVVAEILRLLAKPVHITGDDGPVTIEPRASAGIAVFDGRNGTFDSALREADIALYHAKSRPGSHHTYRTGDHIPRSTHGRGLRLRDQRRGGQRRGGQRRETGRGVAE